MPSQISLSGVSAISFKILIVFLLILNSCSKIDSWADYGEITCKIVPLDPHKQLQINDVFDIEFRSDSVFYFEFKYFESLINTLELNYSDDILKISLNQNFRHSTDYTHPVLVYHYTDSLMRLHVNSACKIYSDSSTRINDLLIGIAAKFAEIDLNVSGKKIYFYTNGQTSGKYNFRGNISIIDLNPYGASIVDTRGLESNIQVIQSFTIADCLLGPTVELKYSINDDGNIVTPAPSKKIEDLGSSGKGKLIIIE